jgi:hypothetical protein
VVAAVSGGSGATAETPAVTTVAATTEGAAQPATGSVGETLQAAPSGTTASSAAAPGAAGVTGPSLPALTALLVTTVSLQANGVTGLDHAAEVGGQVGAANAQLSAVNRGTVGVQIGAGGDLDRPPVLDQVFEELNVTGAPAPGMPNASVLSIVQALLEALRHGRREGIRRNGAPLRPAPVRPAPAPPMPADGEVLWLNPVAEEGVPGPAEGVLVPAREPLADTWLADSSPASLSALLGLAALTAGLSWSSRDWQSEERKRRQDGVRCGV